jgi:prolyl oligopeptidase
MKKVLLPILCLFTSAVFAQLSYPVSPQVDSTDTYFGVTYHDPYRWLEHMKDTSVASWFKQQSNYTNNVLGRLKGRDGLLAEWKALDKLVPAVNKSIAYENGRYFIKRRCRTKR